MNVNELAACLQKKMGETADRLARETGFIKRQRKVSGANFVQTLIFGWLGNAEASLTALAGAGHVRNFKISAQGLHQRFTQAAAEFCKQLLEQMFKEKVVSSQGVKMALLDRFAEIRLIDTTVNALPAMFKEQWPGTGGGDGKSNQAALKVEVSLELKQGALQGSLLSGKTNDNQGPLARASLPADSLQVADLGYFSLERMAQLDEQGGYWLSRLRHDTLVHDAQGRPMDLLEALHACPFAQIEWQVQLGHQHLPARLLVYRVPEEVAGQRRSKMRRERQKKGRVPSRRSLELCGWTLLMTNAPIDKMSLEEALVLYGSRWQIELTFKLWKQHMKIDQSVSQNPWRILCELYIKLMAALVQHWMVLSSACWQRPDKSLVKAYKVISSQAACLSSAFDCLPQLAAVLEQVGEILSAICRQNHRKKNANTWKKLARGVAGWA